MDSCRDCVREMRFNALSELTESLQNARRRSTSNMNMNTQRNGVYRFWLWLLLLSALNNNCINFRLTRWRRIAAFLLMKHKNPCKLLRIRNSNQTFQRFGCDEFENCVQNQIQSLMLFCLFEAKCKVWERLIFC